MATFSENPWLHWVQIFRSSNNVNNFAIIGRNEINILNV